MEHDIAARWESGWSTGDDERWTDGNGYLTVEATRMLLKAWADDDRVTVPKRNSVRRRFIGGIQV